MYQLVYTSSAQSLTRGRSGFSTVARSADMPAALVPKIEALSQYDIASGTVFSHRIVEAMGQKYHVLTRTKDCGLDYTNRNNYIAHHIIISDSQTKALNVSPADIMLGFGGWLDRFDGPPRLLDDVGDRLINSIEAQSLPAEYWKSRFGDCAYAAVLCDGAFISCRVGDALEILKLYSQAILLRRLTGDVWSVTFTTFMLPSDRPSDFTWMAGEPRGQVLVDFVAGKVYGQIPAGRPAEYARTGILTNAEKYNLKVLQRNPNARFNVVEAKKSGNWGWIIALAGVWLLVILAIVLFVFPKTDKIPKESAKAREKPAAERVFIPKPPTLSETLEHARDKISSGDFMGALSYWKGTKYAAENPNYTAALLSDIEIKINLLISNARKISQNPFATDSQKELALKNVSLAINGLSLLPEAKRAEMKKRCEEIREAISK